MQEQHCRVKETHFAPKFSDVASQLQNRRLRVKPHLQSCLILPENLSTHSHCLPHRMSRQRRMRQEHISQDSATVRSTSNSLDRARVSMRQTKLGVHTI